MAKPIVDDVLHAVQQDAGQKPIRLSRGSPSRALPRVALDLATTVERIQSVSVLCSFGGKGAFAVSAPLQEGRGRWRGVF